MRTFMLTTGAVLGLLLIAGSPSSSSGPGGRAGWYRRSTVLCSRLRPPRHIRRSVPVLLPGLWRLLRRSTSISRYFTLLLWRLSWILWPSRRLWRLGLPRIRLRARASITRIQARPVTAESFGGFLMRRSKNHLS